ncbi:ribbon-helix-helix domain-containing protein [Streptomyces olivochromogenes]|uniref:Ribbon-helix-helix protein CopG domain-containing protein n=1 Tax=Streptomyces olivochromogenes TaxID=1963 RepID=A0A250VFF5_STROL|nr:ribbon-helix-helix domain-containing protein [Streptomyces olivochromogenes]KUN47423.1 hypothetical protein AQJ27_10835 [Streptomyces olivochromogenes]GAX52839.1 hypothetical protein SO3561_04358 [Streptomyces olivochromogenes]
MTTRVNARGVTVYHVNFDLAEDVVKDLDAEAGRTGDTRAAVLRRAIHEWLETRPKREALSV